MSGEWLPVTNFGRRSKEPCEDCWPDGTCTMNCGPTPAPDSYTLAALGVPTVGVEQVFLRGVRSGDGQDFRAGPEGCWPDGDEVGQLRRRSPSRSPRTRITKPATVNLAASRSLSSNRIV